MKKGFVLFSFLCLFVAVLYCTGMLFNAAATGMSGDTETNDNNSETESSSTYEPVEQPSSSSVTESVAEAAAKTSVKGKIVYKNVGFDAAALKYNNVFIKNLTSLKIDIKSELAAGSPIKINKSDGPAVLIFHTHTSESFMSKEQNYYSDTDASRSINDEKNVVAVGNVLAKVLENGGVKTIHASEKHDYPEYTGSYKRSSDTVLKYLKKYPSIKIVIDLHRDSVSDNSGTKTAFAADIKGKKAAQVMLVCGCQDGEVTGFPNWRQNFRLALKLQQTTEVMYPSLMRPLYFAPRKYNQNLTNGSLILEFGTEANSLDQAKYSAELMGKSIVSLINTLK